MENGGRDDELLGRARRRDPAALDELVAAFSPRVYGLLYRLTGSADIAQDLTQETFLRVVRTIDRYSHDGRFEAWIFRIAANLARDQVRARRRRGMTLSLDSEREDEESRSPVDLRDDATPSARLAASEDAGLLEAALARLSEPEREILLMRHYGDLSFREIADALNVPLGTALARAHRALQRLKKWMSPSEEDSA